MSKANGSRQIKSLCVQSSSFPNPLKGDDLLLAHHCSSSFSMIVSTLNVLCLIILATSSSVHASGWTQKVFDLKDRHRGDTSPISHPAFTTSLQRPKRIAIIGGGPGGTSTAYFLSRANEKLQDAGRGNEGFEITLFERDERIGGRTAVVHPYFDENLPAVELGASIFADVNLNLKRIAEVRWNDWNTV